jgi:LysR family positive regulator for ilvC
MDIESQKIFLCLAERLHFAKTAQECFITPSTLSRLIQRMEEEIGHMLFERDNRSVRLSPFGEVFKEYAEISVTEWNLFQHRISEKFNALSGELRMCCSVTASYTIFDKVLSIFRKKYPQIRIKLTTSNSEDSLHKILNGNVDISIAIQPVKRFKNLIQREITVSPIRFERGRIKKTIGKVVQEKRD